MVFNDHKGPGPPTLFSASISVNFIFLLNSQLSKYFGNKAHLLKILQRGLTFGAVANQTQAFFLSICFYVKKSSQIFDLFLFSLADTEFI